MIAKGTPQVNPNSNKCALKHNRIRIINYCFVSFKINLFLIENNIYKGVIKPI